MLKSLLSFSSIVLAVYGGTWTQKSKSIYYILDVGINTKTGAYGAALENGIGSMILKSTDLGSSWEQLAERDGFLDIGCGSNSNDSAIVTGALGKGIYTTDGGNTFKDSLGFIPGVQAIAKSRVDKQYGAPGGAGMSVTSDFGATWTHHKAMDINASRYGTLPTEDTWFITTGAWYEPTTTFPFDIVSSINGKNNDMEIIEISSKLRLVYDAATNKLQSRWRKVVTGNRPQSAYSKQNRNHATKDNTPKNFEKFVKSDANRKLLQDEPIWGEIFKTSDGGSTWTKVYSNYGSFYFNAIDCCDENVCFAVAEGDAESGSTNPGARIFQSTNGGSTWTQTYWDPDDAASLMAVHCISDTEAWAAGGTIASNDFNGFFLHTTNAGGNWTAMDMTAPVLFMDMSNDGMYGVASGLTRLDEGVVYGFE